MIKHKIFVAALLGCSVIALVGCVKREIKNIAAQGDTIVCFGDSLTFGYGVSDTDNYPSALAKIVKYKVVNSGIDGDTTVEAIKRIKSDVLDHKPFLVIIEFGGNDFLRKIPFSATTEHVRKMVEAVQAQGALVAVVDVSSSILMNEYGWAYRKICLEKQCIFIPGVVSGIITNPRLKSDFLHPNKTGYELIANRIYRGLKPYLAQNSILRERAKQSN